MYLNSFNHFRAIAIILIVAAHCFGLASLKINTTYEEFVYHLIKGGTFYFVFISGFLFYYIFYNQFSYKEFLTKKIKNIFIPYVLLGIFPIIELVFLQTRRSNKFFRPSDEGFLYEYIIPVIKYYMTGGFLYAYWYIPFIMIVFMMSPLHIRFIKFDARVQLFLIILLFLVSIFLHRPAKNINTLQSVIYYTPVYLLGIYCAINRLAIYNKFMSKEFIFILIAIACIAFQFEAEHLGNYHKNIFKYKGVDWMLLQKIALAMFLMVFLNRFENYKNKAIDILANTSFAVFFLHLFVLRFLKNFKAEFIPKDSWVSYICIVIIVLTLSIFLAQIIKKLLPKYSRYIIGY